MSGHMRRVTAGLCSLAVITGSIAFNVPVAHANVMVSQGAENVVHDSNQQQIIDVFNGINAFRESKGLSRLTFNAQISGVSQKWSEHMATTDQFYHNPDYVSGAPKNWSAATEIIAARNDRTGQDLVNQWIASPSHNSIMSDARLNTVGVGVAFTDMSDPGDGSSRYGMYGTANLFRYENTPVATYNSPEDYFAGKPPMSTDITVSPSGPVWNQSDYVLPNTEGVKYLVNGVETQPGTYPASKHNFEVILEARPGYTFSEGTVTRYTHYYETPVLTEVYPAPPSFNDDAYTYTVPHTEGAEYTVNGTVKPAGVYEADPAKRYVLIRALATEGYKLDTSSYYAWDFTFRKVDIPVAPTAPTFHTTGGSYEIPTTEGIVYTVNGTVTPAGKHYTTGEVTVVAEAQEGYTIKSGSTSTWTETIKATSVTPAAPTQNVMLKHYTIPTTTGVTYTVNGVVKKAGTYWGSGTVTIKSVANPGYQTVGPASWTFVYQNTPLVNSGDMLALDASGNVWNYSNKATTGRKLLVSGWGGAKKLHVVDWNSDGVQDIVTQWKNGSLTIHYGKSTGSFAAMTTLASSGWADMDISIEKYVNSKKYPSIIAKDAAGYLWEYNNPTGTSLETRTLKSSGWKSFKVHLIDWDKDGNMDILAQSTSTGNVILYRTNGEGRFISETRKSVATDWASHTLTTIKDYYGAGTHGVFVRDSAGTLYYYKTGAGVWVSKVLEGSGWNSMNLAG